MQLLFEQSMCTRISRRTGFARKCFRTTAPIFSRIHDDLPKRIATQPCILIWRKQALQRVGLFILRKWYSALNKQICKTNYPNQFRISTILSLKSGERTNLE